MQVQVFSSKESGTLTKQINQWLTEHPGIHILERQVAGTGAGEGRHETGQCFVLIWYQDRP